VGRLDAQVPPSRGKRRDRRLGIEILSAPFHMVMWMTLGISFLGGWSLLFSLEWWGLYSVQGVWFSSRLLLEGTDRIQNFGSYPMTHGTWGILPRHRG
jgi:hypothetical protein